jgi:dolichol kinase
MTDISKSQLRTEQRFSAGELVAELTRKGIHLLIAVIPAFAAMDRSNTVLFLMGGILFYTWAESMRFLGFPLPFISRVTAMVLRKREEGHFALGPVTLGLGALLSLLIFPPPAATAAIYALAFGDSAASLAGKFLGRLRPAFLAGKSLEGSLACFTASALSGFLVFHDCKTAVAVGAASMLVDTLPFKDFDNLFLPLAAGLAVLIFHS